MRRSAAEMVVVLVAALIRSSVLTRNKYIDRVVDDMQLTRTVMLATAPTVGEGLLVVLFPLFLVCRSTSELLRTQDGNQEPDAQELGLANADLFQEEAAP